LYYSPQINCSNIISDTANWTLIYGSFIAQGGEHYLIIGNFYSDTLTDTLNLNGTINAAYYYYDDVNVHCCTCDSVDHTGISELNEPTLNIIPNPATNQFTIENSQLRINAIHIYNVLSEEVFFEQLTTSNQQLSIDVSTWKEGIYFIEVETEKGAIRKKFVKN